MKYFVILITCAFALVSCGGVSTEAPVVTDSVTVKVDTTKVDTTKTQADTTVKK